jgi:hypothetical protein
MLFPLDLMHGWIQKTTNQMGDAKTTQDLIVEI